MAVSKRLRFEILKRDNHTCRYCGGTSPEVRLTVDHVTPTTLGGTDDPSNLVAACADCNSGKSSVPADAPLVEDVASDALRWARAIERAAAITRSKVIERRALHAEFESGWDDWTYGGPNGDRYKVPKQADWSQTLDRFIDAGLGLPDFGDALLTTMAAKHVHMDNKWRYFCGVCWRKISELQDMAKSILLADEQPPGGTV